MTGKKISLTILSLDGLKLGSKSKKALARGLKKNKSLRELCIHNSGLKFGEIFGGDDAQSLRRLTCLDFSGNSFPTSCAQVLANHLSDNTTLQSLSLSKCRLRTEAAKVFLPELERNTTLEFLNLSRNQLGTIHQVADFSQIIISLRDTAITWISVLLCPLQMMMLPQ